MFNARIPRLPCLANLHLSFAGAGIQTRDLRLIAKQDLIDHFASIGGQYSGTLEL